MRLAKKRSDAAGARSGDRGPPAFSLFMPFVLTSWGSCAEGSLSRSPLHRSASPAQASDKATRLLPQHNSRDDKRLRPSIHAHTQLASTKTPRLELPRRLKEESCPDSRASAIHSPGACPFLTRQPQLLTLCRRGAPVPDRRRATGDTAAARLHLTDMVALS